MNNSNSNNSIIGKRIKEAMIKEGLKQADIVKKTGINKGALSSYISGKYEPKQTNIYKLAKVLGVTPAWLMGYDVQMENLDSKDIIKIEEVRRKNDNTLIDDKIKDYIYNEINLIFNNPKTIEFINNNINDINNINTEELEKVVDVIFNEDFRLKENNEKIKEIINKKD